MRLKAGIHMLLSGLRNCAAVVRMSFCYCIDMEIAFSTQRIRKRVKKKKKQKARWLSRMKGLTVVVSAG